MLNNIKDEITFIVVLQIFLFILTGLDFIVNYDGVQNYGLNPTMDWFLPYGIALNAIWIVVAFLTVFAYRLDRPNPSKGTSAAILFTVLGEHFFCYLDSLWFLFVYLTRGNWGWAFENWWWHIFSWIFGYFDLWWCLILNLIGIPLIFLLWYFRYQDFKPWKHIKAQ